MNSINIPTFINIDLNFNLSGAGRRYGAFILDWLIKALYIYIIIEIFGNLNNDSFDQFVYFLILSPVFFYTFIMESFNNGQTVGKMILSIRVISSHGGKPSISQCAIRWFFMLVDAYILFLLITINPILSTIGFMGPLLGAIFIASGKTQQRVGDFAAGTYVVSLKENHYSIEDTIYAYSTKRTDYQVKYPEVIKLSDKDLTVVKMLLEKSEYELDYVLAQKLSSKIKQVLDIESSEDNYDFLKSLLRDYNYISNK